MSEALQSPDKQQWKAAMEKEMELIDSNDVWDLVKLPANRKPIGSKWVFKRKINADGSIERYKARLVAKGFSQKKGLDYDETFSPVVRFESFRNLVAVAVQKQLKLHQLDITAAFLNGRLEMFTKSILSKYRMSDAKPVKTPVCINSKLLKATEESELVDQSLYQSAVGSLLYLSTRSRPDIAFAVSCAA